MTAALFFDLDGTLVDSEHQHWKAWHATLLPLGVELSWPQFQETIGLPDTEILSRIAKRATGLKYRMDSTSILNQKKSQFIELVKEQPPMSPETQEMLRQVSQLQFQLALVTSSSRIETLEILSSAGVTQYFKTIVCLDDIRCPKPNPEPYALAMKNLAVTQGIAFEDSIAGRASAKAAGLYVIGISNSSDLCATVRTNFPDSFTKIIRSLNTCSN